VNKNWVCHNEQYYVIRAASRREVLVDIGAYREEKKGLMKEIGIFLEMPDGDASARWWE